MRLSRLEPGIDIPASVSNPARYVVSASRWATMDGKPVIVAHGTRMASRGAPPLLAVGALLAHGF